MLIDHLGNERIFMYTEIKSDFVVGNKYHVAIDVLDEFIESTFPEVELSNASTTVFYIDEIGRAQIQSSRFKKFLSRIFTSEATILGTIVFDPEPWSIEYKNSKDIILIPVTMKNRNHLDKIIVALLNSCYDYERLSINQKDYICKTFLEFLDKQMFVQARKMFFNSVYYVANDLVNKNISQNDSFVVQGRTRKHIVLTSEQYKCDCDLFNGLGKFAGANGVCSHIEAVKVFLIG